MMRTYKKNTNDIKKITIITILGIILAIFLKPNELSSDAWNTSVIFICTIASLVVKAMPEGVTCIIAITTAIASKSMTVEQAISQFSSTTSWLIFMAFMIAHGFVVTGLGARIAYYFVYYFGSTIRGLAIGLSCAEYILAPCIPSNTARGGGIMFPIIDAMIKELKKYTNANEIKAIAKYLILNSYHVNIASSCLFLTAMAANPAMAAFATNADNSIKITWVSWCLGALLPGTIILFSLPYLLSYLLKLPKVPTSNIRNIIKEKINNLQPLSQKELYMLLTFCFLLTGWIFAEQLNIHPTSIALFGVSILLLTNTLEWNDVLSNKSAFNTFIWLSILLAITKHMIELGVMKWLTNNLQFIIPNSHPINILILICLSNIMIHYLFASLTAHITALYPLLLSICLNLGLPGLLSTMALAISSILGASLTHFGSSLAPIYFSANHVSIKQWWLIGLQITTYSFLMWVVLGGFWWKIIGWI